MRAEDLNSEIEKLKARRVELSGKVNITKDTDEKEELKQEISRLQMQIETLEKFYRRN